MNDALRNYRHYVLTAWSLGLTGQHVVDYVVESSGLSNELATQLIETLVEEMSE